jgi:DNA-binding Xre family transcriptional regulator
MTAGEFCSRLGLEIATERMRKGRSRAWLGEQVGIHRNSVERFEKGADIPVVTFIRICVALGTSSGEMLGRVLDAKEMQKIRLQLLPDAGARPGMKPR